jgi:hypothetical protein
VSPFSSLLPLRQEVLVNQPNELQAALLLDHHFSILESGSIISRIDQTVDWRHPPYSVRKPQLTAVIIFYLAGIKKIPQLVSLMKELRPYVPAIQQFSWEEPDNPFPRKSPDDLFLEVKARPVQRTPSSFPSLEAQLLQNFSLDELDEMCFEAGIEYDRFGAWILQERVTYIAKFLERIDGGPMGKAFIAGCASRVPTFDWAEAVGLDKESIPPIDSVTTNGFYLSRLRSLLEQCLPDNSHIFDFVQAHFPETRRNLSANWPPKKNRVELAGTLKRGAKLHHLFNVLEKEHPQQYLLFAPYSE